MTKERAIEIIDILKETERKVRDGETQCFSLEEFREQLEKDRQRRLECIRMRKLLEDAIEIAVHFHKTQIDKNGEPYILHPLRVMQKCDSYKEKIVAVLHDVLEDTSCTDVYLEGVLESDELLAAVKAITRNPGEKYFDYINRVKGNSIARTVKIEDLKDNLSRMGATASLMERYYKALDILGE